MVQTRVAQSARSILVVDDEPLLRMVLVDLLADQNFEVFEAQDAAEAIEMLKAEPRIGVVITDIQMPGSMDGLALARAIRDSYPPILLIVSSGALRPGGQELPCEAVFLPKPIDMATLMPMLTDDLRS